jgi:hypothetical protein
MRDNKFYNKCCFKPYSNLTHITSSSTQLEIYNFVKQLDNTAILNDRSVITPLELDIWLPNKKIAIEYNGTFWHGYSKYTDIPLFEFKKRIETKRILCEKQNIRLITIDECDYILKKDVYNRFLIDLILPRKRIFARKCEIKVISIQQAREFCEYYHVNGFRSGKDKLGLFYNNELICVAIFAKYKNDYECIRLCYKTGVDVIGGWAKIQKHFGKKFLHYVNLKFFPGENKTGIGYRFIIKHKILHRNALQKKTGLYKYCKNVNPKLSDFNNCIQNGAIAIFDLGNDIRWYNS